MLKIFEREKLILLPESSLRRIFQHTLSLLNTSYSSEY
jgi:hypothetical protein